VKEVKPKHIPLAVDIKTMLGLSVMYGLGRLSGHQIDHEIVGFFVDHRTMKMLTKKFFDALHAKGCWVAVFGPLINDASAQKLFVEWGADMIVTDRPDVLNQSLGRDISESKVTVDQDS
jgi:glycerophosphoryl diester phosphodiesterase